MRPRPKRREERLAAARHREPDRRRDALHRAGGDGAAGAILGVLLAVAKERVLAPLASGDEGVVVRRPPAHRREGRRLAAQPEDLVADLRVLLLEQRAPRKLALVPPRSRRQPLDQVGRSLHPVGPQPRRHAAARDRLEAATRNLVVRRQLLQAVHAVDVRAVVGRVEPQRGLVCPCCIGEAPQLHQHHTHHILRLRRLGLRAGERLCEHEGALEVPGALPCEVGAH
mmetsp:Transcript_10081/g.29912  ORF Transcript_10081/g.29912 Transcript_10081/m.29912 type:complete len:227 (+) Transcript_10081:389-1069(+)